MRMLAVSLALMLSACGGRTNCTQEILTQHDSNTHRLSACGWRTTCAGTSYLVAVVAYGSGALWSCQVDDVGRGGVAIAVDGWLDSQETMPAECISTWADVARAEAERHSCWLPEPSL